jgi:pimeloyl-ACP methyl ester carboxylesterase
MTYASTSPAETPAITELGAGSRTIIFVHGFLDSASAWDALIATMEMADTRSIAISLRGTGASRQVAGPRTLAQATADVAAIVARCAPASVVLVGHSMGAQIAELVAVRCATQVAALVLMTPVPLGGSVVPPDVTATLRNSAGNVETHRYVRQAFSKTLTPAALEALVADGLTQGTETVQGYFDAWSIGHPAGNAASAWPGPALLIGAVDDPFVPPDAVRQIHDARFPAAQLEFIADAGHWPQAEQPRATAAVLNRFLGQVLPPAKSAGALAQGGWKRAFAERTESAFAAVFAEDVVLHASVLSKPVVGVELLRKVMGAASSIYDSVKFVDEVATENRVWLEWNAQAFGSLALDGVTILTKNETGKIVDVRIHHRLLQGVLRFSEELERRLDGALGHEFFDRNAVA